MKKNAPTSPPFTITPKVLDLVALIVETLGRVAARSQSWTPHLRRNNRIQTIQASLAIEQNTLDLEQVTAVLDGKRVLGSPREIQEVRNAFAAYERLDSCLLTSKRDLLNTHGILMQGLVDHPGKFRSGAVGIAQGTKVLHVAPPAGRVDGLITDLLSWLGAGSVHPLVASCVFHYEFEFIHPFMDGNGRMGRLWQTVILSRWNPLFAWLPVETVVRERQADYYAVLGLCDKAGNSTLFVEFMLESIAHALGQLPETDQVADQVTDQVGTLLQAMGDKEWSATNLMKALALTHRPTFRQNYLDTALDAGWIERTDPASPRSPKQRYRLTTKGSDVAKRERK
jgi:Fic family protein